MKKRRRSIISISLVMLATLIGSVFYVGNFSSAAPAASILNQIDMTAYVVSNDTNKNITNGEYEVRFALYTTDRDKTDPYPSNADAGKKLWEENQKVEIKDGRLSAYLGSENPFPESVNFSLGDYYLGIRISKDDEMVPRKKIAAVPTAINSNFLQGHALGTEAGNIPFLDSSGQLDPSVIPAITALGTITEGVWESDVIGAGYGGTGLSSYAVGDLLYASSSSALAKLAAGTSGQFLTITGGLPAWTTLDLSYSQNISNTGDALIIADSDANGVGDIFLKTGATNKMVILNNGNVGIGTDAPTELLDVDGNANVVGTLSVNTLIVNGQATIGTLGLNLYTNTSLIPSTTGLNLGSASNHWANLYVDNLSVGGTDVNGTSSEYFSINTDSVADENMGLRFYRSALNGYAALVWGSADTQFKLYKRENTSELADLDVNNFYAAGNVGIGTSSPAYTLDVTGNIRASAANSVFDTATFVSNQFTFGNGYAKYNDGIIQRFGTNNADNFYLKYLPVNNYFGIYYDNDVLTDPYLAISKTGNVGIGTTGPNLYGDNKGLTIDGGTSGTAGIEIKGNRTDDVIFAGLRFYNLTNRIGTIGAFRDGADNSGGMAFSIMNAGSVGEAMRITKSGNVGIGETSPASRIHGVTTLSAATGDEIAYQLNYTTNKATSGNDTGLLINMTDTASPGTSLLLDAQVGGVSKFSVNNAGVATFVNGTPNVYITPSERSISSDYGGPLVLYGGRGGSTGIFSLGTTADSFIQPYKQPLRIYTTTAFNASSGTDYMLKITPTYNQTSTAAATDLLINRTETAIGSGTQLLIDAQVGGTSRFSVDNAGGVNFPGIIYLTPILQIRHYSSVFELISGANGFTFNQNADSTAGNYFHFKPSDANSEMTASSGQQNYLAITPEWSQTGTAAGTDLLINRTETAVGSGTQLLIDAQVGGVSKFKVDNAGILTATSYINGYGFRGDSIASSGTNATLGINNGRAFSTAGSTSIIFAASHTETSGSNYEIKITPTYNQASGTAANTDLLINRTETAIGSGTQYLIDAQTGSTSMFNVSNIGAGYLAAASWTYGSDSRMKENITSLGYGLASLMQLKPAEFDYIHGQKNQLGFIAQDVQAVLPELVKTMPNGMLGLQTEGMIPVIVSAIQEQQAEIGTQGIQLADINLKTDQNITTIQQLQTSVDEQLGVIQKSLTAITDDQAATAKQIASINGQISDYEIRIKAQEDLAILLQAQIAELQANIATPVDVAQIDLNKNEISYIEQLLGIDKAKPGDIAILGKLSAAGVETGTLTIKIIDPAAATIGQATIPAGNDSVTVDTTAVKKDSNVFVTIKSKLTAEATLMVTDIKAGESFAVGLVAPATEDVKFSWWIVEAN